MPEEMLYSRTVKAGRRVYYIDVKQDSKEEYYLSITESKRTQEGTETTAPLFEKHKIFLYQEDFEKFQKNMTEAMAFIEKEQGKAEPREENNGQEIKIDLDF